jgi:hypothetical protein
MDNLGDIRMAWIIRITSDSFFIVSTGTIKKIHPATFYCFLCRDVIITQWQGRLEGIKSLNIQYFPSFISPGVFPVTSLHLTCSPLLLAMAVTQQEHLL